MAAHVVAGMGRVPSAPRMWLVGSEGVQLSAKNVAALCSLFAVAASLEQLLADGWLIVLGTINCLDCILATPRTAFAPQASMQAISIAGRCECSAHHRNTSLRPQVTCVHGN